MITFFAIEDIGGINITKKNGIFANLSLSLGDMRWPPIATYLFANVCLVTKTGKVVLLLTEERKDGNIWVVPGGEPLYKNLESFQDTVVREVAEELGIELDTEEMELFDVQIGYPVEGSPYEDKGITSIIVSFVYHITAEELANIEMNAISEEGCDIVDILTIKVPNILANIELGTRNVYPALEATLRKLGKHLKKGS
ncbi:MAG: NUDIX domain-containing protein [Candidatus Pacebacteria bacterium]|nr:NUDIX domain-containing protein [Candidatus Paceibacterota bacterium]